MSKKVMHYRLTPLGRNRCGQRNGSGVINYDDVTCKRCRKILDARREKMKESAKPIPAIPAPSDDWRWPMTAEKLDKEMESRSIKLFGYYVGSYRRKITWFPYSKQLEVQCEDSSWRFSEDHHDKAIAKYNDPKVYRV